MEIALDFPFPKSVYIDSNIFMVSWWGNYSYFNNEQIKIGHIEIMTYSYGSSVSSGSILRSKYIGHNTYTGRRSNLCSKSAPIHGPVHKYDLNYSYSRSQFSSLPQAVAKKIMYSLSQKL